MTTLVYPGWCHNRLTDFNCYIYLDFFDYSSLEDGLSGYDFGPVLSNYTSPQEVYYDYESVDPSRVSEENMRSLATTIAEIIFPIILFVGVVGNLISMVIMEKLSREVRATCAYLAVLSIVDSVLLCIGCGNGWVEKTLKRNVSYTLMVHSQSVCKVFPFIFNFIFHLSRWLLVAMAIEGFLASRYPSRLANLCTLPRAKAVVLLQTVLLVCVNVHFFWSFDVMKEIDHLECAFSRFNQQRSEEFETMVWPMIDLLIGELLPDIIITICSISMAFLTYKGLHKGSSSHQEWRLRYTMDPEAQDQLTFVFLFVGVLHVAFSLPHFIYVIIRFIDAKRGVTPNEVVAELVGTLCNMVQYMGSSSKLFVYLGVSSRFRNEVKHRFRCCYKYCDPSRNRVLTMKKSASASSNSRWRSMEGADLESPIMQRAPLRFTPE